MAPVIHILHRYRYWTEYIDFLLDTPDQFPLIASKHAKEDYSEKHPLKEMEVFAPQKHTHILTTGLLNEPTHHNCITMRFLHSPGFFVYPMIRAYATLTTQHQSSDYRFLVLEEHYKALMLKEIHDPKIAHCQSLLMQDPKVHCLKVDPSLCKIRHAPRKETREEGTGLLSLRWNMIDADFSHFLKIAETLKKEIELNLLLHPLMHLDENLLQEIWKLEGTLFSKIYYNYERARLVDLYDQHAFIISEGSGTLYEALLRGCRPFVVPDLKIDSLDPSFDEILDTEYLPFPSYTEFGTAPQFDVEAFLNEYFPFLDRYTCEEANALAREEILSAWNTT